MEAFKKIALKLGVLMVVLVLLNFIYQFTLWETDLEKYSQLSNELKDTENADILYLGDCSDAYFGEGVKDEKGISQLLDSLLTDQKVATISEIGFHAGMYHTILNNIPENSSIHTVIVTMNLRSFSAHVKNTYVMNSINQRLRLLNTQYPPLVNRFLLSFQQTKYYSLHELGEMRMKAWKETPIPFNRWKNLYEWKQAYDQGNVIPFDSSWTDDLKAIGSEHIANYAFQINPKTSERIHDFDEIVTLAKKRKWKLIFHLMPEKIEETKNLVGDELVSLMNHNRNLLLHRYQKDQVRVIDNLELLDAAEFLDKMPNSHFHYKGRKLMAKRIATFLREEAY